MKLKKRRKFFHVGSAKVEYRRRRKNREGSFGLNSMHKEGEFRSPGYIQGMG
jgi:hypothetical protein